MRAYYWGNYYLSSIQQGIQALHTTAEMFVKYMELAPCDSEWEPQNAMLAEWANNHKTVVICNGGDSHDLEAIRDQIASQEDYPWAVFIEEGVQDALTCVGVVVDERIVACVNEVRMARRERRRFSFDERLDSGTYDLVMLIANSMMAR